jgi:hypothetical protein
MVPFLVALYTVLWLLFVLLLQILWRICVLILWFICLATFPHVVVIEIGRSPWRR